MGRTILIALAATTALAGCGSSAAAPAAETAPAPGSPPRGSAAAKFAVHAALAAGTFNLYVYEPFKHGELAPASSHAVQLARASSAVRYIEREVALAGRYSHGEPALSARARALAAFAATLRRAVGANSVDGAAIERANGEAEKATQGG